MLQNPPNSKGEKKIFLKVKEMGRGNWDLERVEKQEASEKIKSENQTK